MATLSQKKPLNRLASSNAPSLLTPGLFGGQDIVDPGQNRNGFPDENQILRDLKAAEQEAKINGLNAQGDLEAHSDFNDVYNLTSRNPDINPVILKLPAILDKEIIRTNDPEIKRTLSILKNCLLRWLTNNKTSTPKPYWVDYDWATDFPYGQEVIKELKENLYNDPAVFVLLDKMKKVIEKGNIDGALKNGNEMEFDFSTLPPEEWAEQSFQSRRVDFFPCRKYSHFLFSNFQGLIFCHHNISR